MITQILIVLLITESISSDNTFMKAVRNISISENNNGKSNQTKRQSNDENALKDEISKYMRECKSDGSDDFSYDTNQRSDNQGYNERNDGSSRTNSDYYRDRSNYHYNKKNSKEGNEYDDNKNIDAYLTNYRSNYNNANQKNSCSDEEDNYDSRQNTDYDNYDRRNMNNRNYNSQGNGGYDNYGNGRQGETFETTYSQGNDKNNPYNTNNYNKHPSNGNDQNYNNNNPYYSRSGDYGVYNSNDRGTYSTYPTNGDSVRWKRSSENCVSQCIFGYIELLDENSMPSETATIKFLQDHMHNDRKRLKLIRDTRRCFSKLATTENEDGCEFSKSLAKCLKLNIE